MTGLEALPDLARKHGLKLMIGAWINSNPVDNAKEVDLLIASANANPDVVTSVIVGNEALLRKSTATQLVKLIEKVKSQIQQPVTYADVWEFWLQHPCWRWISDHSLVAVLGKMTGGDRPGSAPCRRYSPDLR